MPYPKVSLFCDSLKHNVINKDGWYRAAKLTNMGIAKTWTQIMS